MIKRLVTGQYSLALTFWGFGFCGGFLLGLIESLGIEYNHLFFIPVIETLRFILFTMVFAGITQLLRKKITLWAVVACFVLLMQLISMIIIVILITTSFLNN